MHEKSDKMVVAHCWSAKKNEYLTMDMKPDFIRDKADTECIALGDRWLFDDMEMVEGGKTAKELLNEAAARNNAHVCVVGWHGRKGPKKDPTVMGSAVQYMGINATVPVFILKDPIARKDKPNEEFKWCALIDGSKESLRSLIYMAKMKQNQDAIEIIICEQANINTEVIQNVCLIILEEMGVKKRSLTLEQNNISFTMLKLSGSNKVADVVRTYVMEQADYIDFLFLGNTGADFSSKDKNKYIGSVANTIIRSTRINTFFMV